MSALCTELFKKKGKKKGSKKNCSAWIFMTYMGKKKKNKCVEHVHFYTRYF